MIARVNATILSGRISFSFSIRANDISARRKWMLDKEMYFILSKAKVFVVFPCGGKTFGKLE